jgi:uncharacterized protein (DUF2147 family)
MFRNCLIVILLVIAFRADAAAPSPLVGTWQEVGGTGMARIEACSGAPQVLCGTGLARNKAGQLVETGLVLSGVTAAGKDRWKGTYRGDGRKLPATLQLLGPKRVKMKVCLLAFCQSATYEKVR